MKKLHFVSLAAVCILTSLASCTPQKNVLPVDPHRNTSVASPRTASTPTQYLSQLSIDPTTAKYFGAVNRALALKQEELALLQRNGFVVTDRLAWDRFVDAYAWIYWKDLPVLVTTDSILHSVHQSYDDLLKDIERAVLIPDLNSLLALSQNALGQAGADNEEKRLDQFYNDVSAYLTVGEGLLNGREPSDKQTKALYLLATNADQVADVDLFGNTRSVDFTLFKPRGHYAEDKDLQQYFRAMNWLAQIDFRFVEFDELTSQPVFHINQVTAASILRQAIDASFQRGTWKEMNALLESLVGQSDNTALPDLDELMADMGLASPSDVLNANGKRMLELLLSGDYGSQRITGQLIFRHQANNSSEPIPRPISFMLVGQRFAVDSYVLGNLVYDRMMKDGEPILRALPSTLDVAYSLGNDRALTHLDGELNTYDYGKYLSDMRGAVDSLPDDFWRAPAYNQWLGMIRQLNAPTTGDQYPQSMRTEAWADKMLQTQLASWAQLRHDNVLYVKQSVTTGIACEYPAGYVEPYPEFYGALYAYASAGYDAVLQASGAALGGGESRWEYVKKGALTYFDSVRVAAEQLKSIAEKELTLKEFSEQDVNFLKSVVVRQKNDNRGCGGPEFVLDGWYVDMFYGEDKSPALIVDVHTNPNNDGPLAPARVLHAATGEVVPICLVAETDEGSTAYVGPSFTYYDVVETGFPPVRLTDKDWQSRLGSPTLPTHPSWTNSFLFTNGRMPERMAIGP